MFFAFVTREVRLMEEKQTDVLTIEELADYLKIPKSTIYKLVREGKAPCQKVGRHWRFHRSAIEAWLKERGGTGIKNTKESQKIGRAHV